MTRFLFDTNVFVYQLGAAHPYREPCRTIVARQAAGELAGEASATMVQEVVWQRLRQTGDRDAAAQTGRDVAALCRLHDFTAADMARSIELFESHDGLDAFDAQLAATALGREIALVLTADRGFDGIAGLRRVDPLDAQAVASLVVRG